ncbi:MAG: D-alanyl-D-alanine carboxypeptidase family protein [Eubacteriales bacterium]|nr:D-alanyl-D-alanine carboxypeptidase family protein [Eubacteriales bacterium]
MKRFLGAAAVIWLAVLLLCTGGHTYAEEQEDKVQDLYAVSAVLMDGDSGRVLYEKNGEEIRPMASTTKIMTCILALENSSPDDIVEVSAYAQSMPDVQLNMMQGEQYRLNDLLYSLMLESHNDTAVAIAEHVAGSVEQFADLMNEKAKEIGCKHTHYVTPNGLDGTDEEGIHATTAEDLALVMAYCIGESPKKKEFLKVTGTSSYIFSNLDGSRTFTCNNHNAFLNMMEGAISGKTGFTSAAGYCYVGALRRDSRTFIVALLGCGWPDNRSYKWSDTRKLMQYGLENYEYRSFDQERKVEITKIDVEKGQGDLFQQSVSIQPILMPDQSGEAEDGILMRKEEKVERIFEMVDHLKAPVEAGQTVGSIRYVVDGVTWRQDLIVTEQKVEKIDFSWCLGQVLKIFVSL